MDAYAWEMERQRGETMLSLFEKHLEMLERNELWEFSCVALFQVIHSAILHRQYACLKEPDNHERNQESYMKVSLNRIEKALLDSSRVNKLYLVLGWERKAKHDDGISQFLATSTSLYDVTFVSPHASLSSPLASYLWAVAQNPSRHIQRLQLKSSVVPMPALCQLLQGQGCCLRLLVLDGREGWNATSRTLTWSFTDLDLFGEALAQNNSLRELSLESISFRVASWNPRLSRKKHPQNQSIRTLNITLCNFDSALMAQRLMDTFGKVERIRMHYNQGLNAWVYKHYKPCSSLKDLHDGNRADYSYSEKNILEFLERSNLQGFSNTGRGMTETTFWKGVKKIQSLQELSIERLPHHEMPCCLLTSGCLKSLSIRIPCIPTSFLAHLASPQCHLLKLKLHLQSPTGDASSAELWKRLQQLNTALCHNCSLKQAELSWDHIPDFEYASSPVFVDPRSCFVNNLQRFSIAKSNAPPLFYEGMFRAMTSSLSSTDQLAVLELGWLSWSDEAVDLLCRYLRHPHCSLESLWLHGTCDRRTVNSIFEALSESDRISSVHITCRLADLKYAVGPHLPRMTQQQVLAISLERSGTNENQSEEDVGEKAIQADFLKALRNNRSLYQVTVEGGSLDPNEYWFSHALAFYGLRNKVDALFASGSQLPLGLLPILLEQLQRKAWCPSIVFHALTQSAAQLGAPDRPTLVPVTFKSASKDGPNWSDGRSGATEAANVDTDARGRRCWKRLQLALCRRGNAT